MLRNLAINPLSELGVLCFTSAAQGKSDDLVDVGGVWWDPGQDILATCGEIQVPLYGPVELT
jgi:hypothetical protein